MFSQCQAGDIRISYDSVDVENGVSVVAGVTDDFSLDIWNTSREYEIGYLYGGEGMSVEAILGSLKREQRWVLYGAHALAFVWILVGIYAVDGRIDMSLRTLGKIVFVWVGVTEGIRAVVQQNVGLWRLMAIVSSIGGLYLVMDPRIQRDKKQ